MGDAHAAIWALERTFWLEGAPDDEIGSECVMAFPDPVGILRGEAITLALAAAPRWREVDFAHEEAASPTKDVVVLAYKATGRREGGEPYHALCSSTYVRRGAEFRIVQHHQTPIA